MFSDFPTGRRGTWSCRTRRSSVSSGIQKYGRIRYLFSSSIGGKHQNKGRNVRGGRRGKTDVVDAPFKIIFENREGTGVSLAHRHPVDGLLHPLVEP